MVCRDTNGSLEFHLPEGVIKLAVEIYPMVQDLQMNHRGNGTIILPVTGGTIGSAELETRKKFLFRMPIRLPWSKSSR